MRITLVIDDDVLTAARALATERRRPVGEIVSELARRSLARPVARSERNGIPLLPVTNLAAQVTLVVVNELRDT